MAGREGIFVVDASSIVRAALTDGSAAARLLDALFDRGQPDHKGSNPALSSPGAARGCGVQWRHQRLIAGEQEGEAQRFGGKTAALAIGGIHRAVQRHVCGREARRHRQRVVEVRKGGAGMDGAGIDYLLRCAFDGAALSETGIGPGKRVVDNRG